MQCKTWFKQNTQIQIPDEIADEIPQERQHSAGGLSDYDTFHSLVQVPKNISAISHVLFNILTIFSRQIELTAFFNERPEKKLWKFWPDFVDSSLDVSTSRNSEWKDEEEW